MNPATSKLKGTSAKMVVEETRRLNESELYGGVIEQVKNSLRGSHQSKLREILLKKVNKQIGLLAKQK